MGFIIGLIAVGLIAVFAVVWIRKAMTDAEIHRAGRQGEIEATRLIRQVLHDDDVLLTNVNIQSEGKRTELDNVVINRNGIFIVEVKNYNGVLIGNENDFEWKKVKTTNAGNSYEKPVKNPIKQVKRQKYILLKLLEQNHLRVWINGYVLLLQGNSPVESDMVLSSMADFDSRIHTPALNQASQEEISRVRTLLGG